MPISRTVVRTGRCSSAVRSSHQQICLSSPLNNRIPSNFGLDLRQEFLRPPLLKLNIHAKCAVDVAQRHHRDIPRNVVLHLNHLLLR